MQAVCEPVIKYMGRTPRAYVLVKIAGDCRHALDPKIPRAVEDACLAQVGQKESSKTVVDMQADTPPFRERP
jgi:hypothetical protein